MTSRMNRKSKWPNKRFICRYVEFLEILHDTQNLKPFKWLSSEKRGQPNMFFSIAKRLQGQ